MKHTDYLNINYLRKNEQLCFTHYMKYVEHKRKKSGVKEMDKSELSGGYSLDDIKVNTTGNGVLLSEKDFNFLVQKIESLEAKIEEKNKEIEESKFRCQVC